MKSRLLVFTLSAFLIAGAAFAQDPEARIAKFDGDRAAAISYTFDDNLRDQYTLAVPMLNEVGFKGTFFVIPGRTAETVEEAEQRKDDKRPWGTIAWPELEEMAEQGHEIGNHTWTHPNLTELSMGEVGEQLNKAYDAIQERLGKPPLTLAFPFNARTPEIEAVALKHHAAYRTYQTSLSEKSTIESLNAWADKLVRDNKWGVIMGHAISKGYAALTEPEILRDHLKHVKSREGEIWVDTFANIARYEKERDNATLTCSEAAGSLQCVLSGSLDPHLYDVPLTVVIEGTHAKSARAERAGKQLPVRVENGSVYVKAAPGEEPITVTWK